METSGRGSRQTGAIETPVVSTVLTSASTSEESPGPSSCGSVTRKDILSPKKTRTQFSPKQLVYLEECFLKNRFPSAKERESIAEELDLTTQHIQVWFQNRRAKHRRKSKRKQEIEANASAIKVPSPPAFWPSNLSFDSNLSKDNSIKKSNINGNPPSESTSFSSKQVSLASFSTTVTTGASPIVVTSRLNLPSLDHSSLDKNMMVEESSSSILAQSPVHLQELLHDLPDLMSSFGDESSAITSSQVPPVVQQNLPQASHHKHYGVPDEPLLHMPNQGQPSVIGPLPNCGYPSSYIQAAPSTIHPHFPGANPLHQSLSVSDAYVPYGHYPAHHTVPTPVATSPTMTSLSQGHTTSPSMTQYHFGSTHYYK
ncbi:PREDICTED: homeobox protein ceh-8-like isoform X2 [Amphimedon queenslandica]|uniref:Homeobox domain-containing protein n=1 Tax=Amphimedon queenslandica TaxID=400682 RepID=A0AAN0K577_AMPQE|nr:PREDICTED: homeobox protein ceh-8-like isoform X2 [Amphimedon queenslandica]|eukprot:XP_019864471.1 PREDICTED: homeobox protein ceh-8-like isoform X2 [Amphimedon queenslandica]